MEDDLTVFQNLARGFRGARKHKRLTMIKEYSRIRQLTLSFYFMADQDHVKDRAVVKNGLLLKYEELYIHFCTHYKREFSSKWFKIIL